MPTELLVKEIPQHLDYDENGTTSMFLPRTNPFRRIYLRFRIKQKSGATKATGEKNYDYLNLIKNVKITVGSEVASSYDAISKYEVDGIELGVKPIKDANVIPNTSTTGDFLDYYMIIDYSFVRKQLRRFSEMLLPANFADIQLSITWGDAGDIYTAPNNTTIDDDTYCEVSYVGAYRNGEDDGLIPRTAPLIREILQTEHRIEEEYTSLDGAAYELPVRPTGNTVLRELWIARKNIDGTNPSYSDDVIKRLQYRDVRGGGETYLTNEWKTMSAEMHQDFTLQETHPGILMIDWGDIRNSALRIVTGEQLKTYFTTDEPASGQVNGIRLWQRYV